MANNKSIQILRGSNSQIFSHSSEILNYGQLLFNNTKRYLTVGGSSNSTSMNSQPIRVREVWGLFDDFDKISQKDSDSNYYSISDNSGTGLKIYSSKKVDITSGDVIKLDATNGIVFQQIPTISTNINEEDDSNNVATTRWVRMAAGNTSLNASSADKLNTDAGSGNKPIYFSSGIPKAFTSTIGKSNKPVYLSSGTITASNSTIGSTTKPIYMSSGELKEITGNVGSTATPVYLSSGTITATNATVGSSTKPVYMNRGTITATGSSLAVSITGTAAQSDKIKISGTYRTISFSNGILSFS